MLKLNNLFEKQDVKKEEKKEEKAMKENHTQTNHDNEMGALKNELAQIKALLLQEAERKQVEEEKVQFIHSIVQHEKKFSDEHPDYAEAADFIKERRMNDFKLWGIQDPQIQEDLVQKEIVSLASIALENGQNPAEKAYLMAKAWGFGHKDLGKEEEKKEAKKPHHKSLSQASGEVETPLSFEALSHLSEDEFEQKWQEMAKAAQSKNRP